jgi:predicted dehydrogenase
MAARIAVAGAGLIGRRHVELVRESPDCELAAVVDPAPAAAELAAAAGVAHFRSLADCLAAEAPHGLGVVVASPNRLHVPMALECVERGVPVLVEKPIADTVEDGLRLAAAAEAAGVPVLVGHHRRHSPLLETAQRLVANGTLGSVVAVQGSALFYKPDDYFDTAPWRREPGGGPILINMIHEVDDLRAVCGDVVAVQAMATNRTRGFPVEDTVAIALRFASGALGTFLLSDTAAAALSWEHTSMENPSYPAYPDEDCYVIAGTRGSLSVPTMRLRTYAGARSWWEPFASTTVEVERADPLARQLAHFRDVVEGTAKPRMTAADAVQTLRVTAAIAEAARTGELVELP